MDWADSNYLSKGTVDALFNELEDIPILEKKNYLDDWIIHFASTNPIFEPSDDENKIDGYIFIKDNPTANYSNVFIVGDSFSWDSLKYELSKIKNTNWFYIKFTRPKGTRIYYLICPVEIGTKISDLSRIEDHKLWKLDNRNKQTAEDTKIYSVTQFPGFYPFSKYSENDVKFHQLRLPRRLQGTRSAEITVIKKKEKKSPKKLIIVHDGETALKLIKIDKLLKFGVDNGRWPSIALVTLSVNIEDRNQEYGNFGPQYPLFFKEHILTTIEDYLNKSFKPDDIIVYGCLTGARAAFDVIWNNPNRIKNVICQSSPWLSDKEPYDYISLVSDTNKKKLGKIYIDSGIYETNTVFQDMYENNKKMATILRKKKYKIMGKEYFMGHRYQSYAWALPSALDYIIHDKIDYQSPTGRKM